MSPAPFSSSPSRRLRAWVVLLCAGFAVMPAVAAANITSPTVLAGPDNAIVEFGGIALASDGTGGAIWRQTDASGSHIFVARYATGAWAAPTRVDTTLPFDSFSPRIAAAPGGQLIAIWAQDYAHRGTNKVFRLSSSVIKTGESAFETPVTIDSNVGSDLGTADDLDPVIRANEAGQAYLTYRVTLRSALATNASGSFPKNAGRIVAAFRVARYNGGTWSSMGLVNRDVESGVPVYTEPAPAPGNGPQVSIDQQGNGVVAFLEPDGTLADRVWARRLFASRQGNVLRVSPNQIGDQPLNGSADAFALAGGGLGTATVLVRQQPGRPSPLTGARMFLSTIPDSQQQASTFTTPVQLPDASGLYSVPSASVGFDEGSSVAFASSGNVIALDPQADTDGGHDIADGPVTGAPLISHGPAGATAAAWPAQHAGADGVAIYQSVAGSSPRQGFVSSPLGGEVRDLSLGASGLGDGLVGFLQGAGDSTEVVVSAAQVPPQAFVIYPPVRWVRPRDASISWNPASSGVGGLRYDVYLDGKVVARSLTVCQFQLPVSLLDDGQHRVNVRATDAAGQSAFGAGVLVRTDSTPPTAQITLGSKRSITVRVRDGLNGAAGTGSGVNQNRVRIRFGDGRVQSGLGVMRHVYKRAGRYRVTVTSADAAGNLGTTILRATVR